MTNDSLLALVAAVAAAIVILSLWRLILAGFALTLIAVFVLGLSDVAQFLTR